MIDRVSRSQLEEVIEWWEFNKGAMVWSLQVPVWAVLDTAFAYTRAVLSAPTGKLIHSEYVRSGRRWVILMDVDIDAAQHTRFALVPMEDGE